MAVPDPGFSTGRTAGQARADGSAPASTASASSCHGPSSPTSSGGELAGLLEELAVGAQAGEAEVAEAGLAGAEEPAFAAEVEVALGELEAVVRLDERLEPGGGRLGELELRARDQQAVGLLGAAADAAAELVELGEAEPVCLLDDHDRRVRDVDADLDHRRRHEHVELALLERAHHLAPLRRLQPAVEQPDAVAAQLGAREPRGLLLGRAREPGLRRLDQRADDVGLPPGVEVHAEPRVGLARALGPDPRRDDRLAARRRLRDLGHVELAEHGQRERARDRRRGHVQQVRPQARERLTLLDAEAVLLVDDRDREVGELDVALDQRVGPDDDLRLARGDLGASRASSRRSRSSSTTRTPSSAQIASTVRKCCSASVSVGAIKRALPARLDRAQKGVERDDRLARADVALQQPLHRPLEREIAVDLGDRLLLVAR